MDLDKLIKKASKASQSGDFGLAKVFSNKIISKAPDNALGYKLLATNLIKLNQFIDANKCIEKAIALGDKSLILYRLQATVWIEIDELNLALNQLEQLFNQTGDMTILLDIALAYQRLGQFENAESVYSELIKHKPEHHQARYSLSILQLYSGDFVKGWQGFEIRHKVDEAYKQKQFCTLYQLGDSVINKRVLVVPEQGIGDQLIFASCLPDLVNIAKEVLVICDERLKALFINSFKGITVFTKQNILEASLQFKQCDLQIPIGTLPFIFRPSVSFFPNVPVYKVTNTLTEKLKLQLASDKLNVGISWYGGQCSNSNINRWSSKIADWKVLFQVENIQWYDLQFGEHRREVAKESFIKGKLKIVNDYNAGEDFSHYGALINQLDLVISVDNAAAIFSAFLGKETWVLVPKDPFWVWSQNEMNSPWFSDNVSLLKKGEGSWIDSLRQLQPRLISLRDLKLSSMNKKL